MQPMLTSEKHVLELAPPSAEEAESGMLLMNMALELVASDRGALNILRRRTATAEQHPPPIPEVLIDALRSRRSPDPACTSTSLWVGKRCYHCRFYTIQSDDPTLGPAFVAVHFDADAKVGDPVWQIATDYHLTEREKQALRGMALGLSTKELADRMRISPNTVKSFVRLIMIKLGVTSRAEIMVKLLEISRVR